MPRRAIPFRVLVTFAELAWVLFLVCGVCLVEARRKARQATNQVQSWQKLFASPQEAGAAKEELAAWHKLYASPEEAAAAIEELRRQLREWQQAVDNPEAIAKLIERCGKLDAENRELARQVHSLTAERNRLQEELSTVKGKLTQAEAEVVLLRARNELLAKQLKETRERLRALQEANQDLARLLEVESKLAAVQKELAETQTKLAETAAALEKSNDERDRLKQQVADLERRLQEAQDGWAASQSELAQQSALRQEIVGLKAKEGKMRRVVVVIDKSGSMLESNRWTDAQKVLRDWMRYLPMDECALVLFSNSMTVFPRGSNRFLRVSGTEGRANRDRICDLLADIVPNGGTDTLAALRKAYEYESPDAILLFTDGAPCKGSVLDMFSKYDPDMVDDIMDLVQKQKNRGIPINVVGMGNYFDKKFSKFLLDLARNTGGSFIGR